MSVTDPRMPRTEPAEPPRDATAATGTARVTYGLLAAGVLVVLAVFLVWQTYPNYDTYYTLVWGQELGHGHLPDYDVFRTPTPHPLSTLVALGDGAVRHGERPHPRARLAVRAARLLRRHVPVHPAAAGPADRADRRSP